MGHLAISQGVGSIMSRNLLASLALLAAASAAAVLAGAGWPGVALLGAPSQAPPPQDVEVLFETNSSILTSVGFTKVTVTQGASSSSVATGESGFARAPVRVGADVPAVIRLGETAAADGLSSV